MNWPNVLSTLFYVSLLGVMGYQLWASTGLHLIWVALILGAGLFLMGLMAEVENWQPGGYCNPEGNNTPQFMKTWAKYRVLIWTVVLILLTFLFVWSYSLKA